MDDATADLILSLQLQDLYELQEGCEGKGKGKEDQVISDMIVAIELSIEELQRTATTFSDQHLGRTIGEADDSDGELPISTDTATPSFNEILSRFSTLNLKETCEQVSVCHHNAAEDSSSCSQHNITLPAGTIESCCACGDGFSLPDLIQAPCNHYYCSNCIATVFNNASRDESDFPARCCRPEISIDLVQTLLGNDLTSRYKEKSLEFRTHVRTYCHDNACNQFIPPDNIEGDKATCVKCNKVTCKICKSAGHDNDCPEDPELPSFMEAAAAAGFRQCRQCNRMIELNTGCNHMT